MGEAIMQSRQANLKVKRICRFCLTQAEPLSQIYSRENRLKSSAPLPLQVMACVSIEVFTNDGMPSTICDLCRVLMEHCYRFKQMCKKADTALRQYPLTGTWPKQLDIPKVPEDLTNTKFPKILNPGAKFAATSKQQISPEKPKMKIVPPKVILNAVPKPTTLIKSKILNKSNTIKILNKDVMKPVIGIGQPMIKEKDDGAIEIVTEILESLENQNEQLTVEETRASPPIEEIETNVFPCPHCERSFPLRQLLDIHMVNHNRDRDFECDVCQKRFFSKYDLGKHTLIHTGEKPYECIVCKKAFTRSTLLHRHEKIHTDIPKFVCVFCEKPFLSKDELGKHTERHKKNRPFACKICGKSFAFKQGLERHEVIHAKEQPFPCQYCDESFPTPSKLSRHLTAHAGARPFPCKLCPKSYLLSHHLTRHLRSHKEGSGSYKCFDCEQNFTTRDDLIYHSAVHATQTLVCPLCKEHFEDLDLVTEHIRLHAEGEQYACEFCDLIFMTADKLTVHSDAEHSADLAVYEEHTRNNIKRERAADYNDSSHDDGEVLQEFIVDEYEQSAGDKDISKESNESDTKPKLSGKGTKRTRSQKTESLLQQIDDFDELELQKTFDDINESSDDDMSDEPEPKKLKTFQRSSKIKEPVKSPVIKIEKADTKLKQPLIKTVLTAIPKPTMSVKVDNESTPNPKRISGDKSLKVLDKKPINLAELKKVTTRKSVPAPSPKDKLSPKDKSTTKDRLNPKAKPTVKEEPTRDTKSFSSAKGNKGKSPEAVRQVPGRSSTQSRTPEVVPSKKVVEMVIGDRKVKVQKITMTKAEAQKMAKEGRIKMENGAMILKQSSRNQKNLRKTRNSD